MTDTTSTELEPHRDTPAELAVPDDVAVMWKMAQRLAVTDWAPRGLRGKPNDVLGAIVLGHSLGMNPVTSLLSIHVVDGTPTLSAKAIAGMILSKGHRLHWRELSAERVVLDGQRRDSGSTARVIWTIEDAKRAGLAGKNNWKNFPRQMLAARATTEIGRLLFADLLHGIAYSPEEIDPDGRWTIADAVEATAADSPSVVYEGTGVDLDEDELQFAEGWEADGGTT